MSEGGASLARRERPLLRGVSHALAAVGALFAAALLVDGAASPRARAGAAVYGLSLVILFTTSALYHRILWADPRVRSLVGRVDHSAIFVLIAGTYTPFCLLIGPPSGMPLLVTVWASALVGMGVVTLFPRTPKPVRSAIYVMLGWLIVPFLPALHGAIGLRPFLWLLVGGASYTVGAVVYALRRPDPWPQVFGFHEIFHVLVVAAAAAQLVAVAAALGRLGAVG